MNELNQLPGIDLSYSSVIYLINTRYFLADDTGKSGGSVDTALNSQGQCKFEPILLRMLLDKSVVQVHKFQFVVNAMRNVSCRYTIRTKVRELAVRFEICAAYWSHRNFKFRRLVLEK